MKRTKEQKGITLIALIITIVVLLILAVVAINSIQNDGILGHAQNAAGTYNQAVANEQGMLQEYEDYLTGINGGFESYTLGKEVTIGGETFYVIKDSPKTESKLVLLAKYNIIVDETDAKNLTQSSSAGTVKFSETAYWADAEGNILSKYEEIKLDQYMYKCYDLTEEGVPDKTRTAAYAAYQYGVKVGGAGRLMTYHEAYALDYHPIFGSKLHETSFWVCALDGGVDCASAIDSRTGVGIYGGGYDDANLFGVRPVIEISKSKVTSVTE